MCGITGAVSLSGDTRIERDVLAPMADALQHRGPDDLAFYTAPGLGFGFTRLAIRDVAHGQQPVHSEDGRVTSICNGEIYNFRQLRSELVAKGYRFRTECDTEIIPALYQAWGIEFLKRLNGQFALALFDHDRRALFLARDHVGIAPLFHAQRGDTLVFGSEIKALLRHPAVRPVMSLRGLDQILTFPGLVSPTTMFKGVHALRPGHYLQVSDGTVKDVEYWDLVYPTELRYDESDEFYIEGLREVLREAVRDRLQADVPVGYYISGGLDSSLIAALIHECTPQQERHAFSIAFDDVRIDERRHQRLLAEHLRARRHEIVFDEARILASLREAVYCAETPLKESYNTCSMALSRAARDHGVKVVLTGEGADELFGGYVGYRFDQMWRAKCSRPAMDADDMLENEERARLFGDEAFFYERDYYAFRETKQSLYSQPLRQAFAYFNSVRPDVLDTRRIEGRHPLHKRSYVDFKMRMSDHLLADHGDRVAYRNSVEARFPFLDLRVIEFAQRMPPRLKLNGMVEKYALKKIGEGLLPPGLAQREKFAFVAPGSQALIAQDVDWVNHYLSAETIRRQGLFDPDVVASVRKLYAKPGFRLNLPYDIDLLIIVLTAGIFVDIFGINDLDVP